MTPKAIELWYDQFAENGFAPGQEPNSLPLEPDVSSDVRLGSLGNMLVY